MIAKRTTEQKHTKEALGLTVALIVLLPLSFMVTLKVFPLPIAILFLTLLVLKLAATITNYVLTLKGYPEVD